MKRLRFAALLSGVMLAAIAANASGIGTMYIDTSDGNLYAGNPDTASPSYALVGNTGISGGLTDIGFSNGVLYGLDSAGNLYSINTSTAAPTLIGSTGITDGSLVGLSDSASGVLLAGGHGQTYSLNTTTGAATSLGAGGEGQYAYGTAGDLDFDGSGNLWLTSSTPTADTLFGISPTTGAIVASPGALPYPNVYGLAYDNISGDLWGYSAGGMQFDVDTSDAGQSGQRSFFLVGGNDALILGAAFIASPEPSTLVLIGTGLILVAASLWGRRSRRLPFVLNVTRAGVRWSRRGASSNTA
jgi:hypothetical protein